MDTQVARQLWTLSWHGITSSIHLIQMRFTIDIQPSRFPFIAKTGLQILLLAAVGSTFSVLQLSAFEPPFGIENGPIWDRKRSGLGGQKGQFLD